VLWSGGVDTTRWITIELGNPLPANYSNDWLIMVSGSANILDTCSNVISADPFGDGIPGASSGDGLALILPVELVYFNAVKHDEQSSKINWLTAVEKNVSLYTVERSKDGSSFESLGNVSVKGLGYKYEFIDNDPYSGINYYRLKITDEDGNVNYSVIKIVEFSNEKFQFISVRPIPTTGKLNVSLLVPERQLINIEITNLLGEPVIMESTLSEKGAKNIVLSLDHLEVGVYFLNVYNRDKSNRIFKKIIKQ